MPAASSGSRTSIVTWIGLIAAVALGASTAYFAVEARAARRDAAAAKAAKAGDDGAVTPVAAGGDRGDEARRLRAENQELRRRLMEREAPRAMPDGGAARSWADRFGEMRKTDPERYKRMMERREQHRAEIEATREEQLAKLDQRIAALGQVDTPEAKKEAELVNKIAAVMSELNQIGEKMQAVSNLPEAERQAQAMALGQQARDLYGQLSDLRAEDRRNQLNALAGQLGLSGDQAAQMSSSVDRIVKDTDSRGMRPRGPGGAMGARRSPP